MYGANKQAMTSMRPENEPVSSDGTYKAEPGSSTHLP